MEDRRSVEYGFGVEHFVQQTWEMCGERGDWCKSPTKLPSIRVELHPTNSNEPADLKAFYRLMNNPNVTHESVWPRPESGRCG